MCEQRLNENLEWEGATPPPRLSVDAGELADDHITERGRSLSVREVKVVLPGLHTGGIEPLVLFGVDLSPSNLVLFEYENSVV